VAYLGPLNHHSPVTQHFVDIRPRASNHEQCIEVMRSTGAATSVLEASPHSLLAYISKRRRYPCPVVSGTRKYRYFLTYPMPKFAKSLKSREFLKERVLPVNGCIATSTETSAIVCTSLQPSAVRNRTTVRLPCEALYRRPQTIDPTTCGVSASGNRRPKRRARASQSCACSVPGPTRAVASDRKCGSRHRPQ